MTERLGIAPGCSIVRVTHPHRLQVWQFVATRDAAFDALVHLGANYPRLSVTVAGADDVAVFDPNFGPFRSGWDLAAAIVGACVPNADWLEENIGPSTRGAKVK
jgi:hypothetical protein